MIDVRHMKKLFLWMLLTAGCNPKKNVLSRRPEHKFFKSLKELATLKQLFVFRCSDCVPQSETQC